MPSLPELQKAIDDFIQQNNMLVSTESRLLDLTSGVGELCKSHLTSTNYGRRRYVDGGYASNWMEEMGDVLFSLICLANIEGYDLEKALEGVLDKYRKRIDSRGRPDSGR